MNETLRRHLKKQAAEIRQDKTLPTPAAKLWLYSNLVGTFGWAESKSDFIRRYPDAKDGELMVRCAHIGVKPKDGYRKGVDELANTPIELISAGVEKGKP